MLKVDFTTTAVCRPGILRRTYQSFRDNLRGIELCEQTLYIHIDPTGGDDNAMDEVVRVAGDFFKTVIFQIGVVPSFPAAVKWCWSRPETEYFFHLEDDWLLARPFDLESAVETLDTRTSLSCVNLSVREGSDTDLIFLRPGLFRSSHMRVIGGRLSLNSNPEVQLRPTRPDNPDGGRHLGFFGTTMPKYPVLEDIGRDWLAASGYKKNYGSLFTAWVDRDTVTMR